MTELGFTSLWQGGRLAWADPDSGDFRPAKTTDGDPMPANGEDFYHHCYAHINGDQPIGVYPLMADDTVWWCGIDYDEGDHNSLIHAANTIGALRHLGITAWCELSRSKGCHVLLFLEEPASAELARQAMLGVAQRVSAPTREAYPKQRTAAGGWGNGLRLPYGRRRPYGRQVVINRDLDEIPLGDWVEQALEHRTAPVQLEAAADLWAPPAPPRPAPRPATRSRLYHPYTGIARSIWDNGLSARQQQPGGGGRSAMLTAFAASLLRQHYPTSDVEIMVAECDQRWGQKYTRRPDGAQRIAELVASADRSVRQHALFNHQGEPDEEPF